MLHSHHNSLCSKRSLAAVAAHWSPRVGAPDPDRLLSDIPEHARAIMCDVNRPDFRSVLQARMELDEQEVLAGDA